MEFPGELREQLLRPHSKPSLSFPRELREQLERDCGFTDDEVTVLRLCGRGWCYAKIADAQHCSVEVVKKRVRSIKNKIAQVI